MIPRDGSLTLAQVLHKRLTFLVGPEAQEIFFKALDTGLELKLDSPDAPETATSVSVVHWFESLASTMELLGLETVFLHPHHQLEP